jgi:hypothetical protein
MRLLLIVILGAGALVGWNLSRFVGAQPVIVSKELAFLPGPTAARLLSMGHPATAAKLRWIDSFRFQQLVFDRKDDRLADGSSVFARLYDTLIPLDPYFVHFYDGAVVNMGGLLGRHDQELRYAALSILNLPHNMHLQRQHASILAAFFGAQERTPEAFDAVLTDWAESRLDPTERLQIDIWKAALGSRAFTGLEQAPYWLEQLQRLGNDDGFHAVFVRDTLYDLLTGYAASRIAAHLPADAAAVQDASWEPAAPRLAAAFAALPQDAQPPLALMPIARRGDGWALRSDPWGLPWHRDAAGVITARGAERRALDRLIAQLNLNLAETARTAGRWPGSLAEVISLGIVLPPQPPDGSIALIGQGLRVTWQPPPAPPWTLTPGG